MQFVLRLHRLSAGLAARKMTALSRAVDLLSRLLFAGSIPGAARIGERVFFHHSALGVVINRDSVIEDDCEIGVHVVLGGRSPRAGAPRLQRRVVVHAGARLIGPICIGEGSVIGANAVVLGDVPPRSLVVGVPGVIKRSDIDNRGYARAGFEA